MKPTFIFFLACAVNVVSGQSDPPKTKAPATRTAPPEIKIPEGATKTDDGSFKFTDAKGKKWIYRNTPFGVAKTEDKPVDPSKPGTDIGTQMEACQPGDTSPAGTVVDGYKKVIEATPFGDACRWIKGN